MLVPNTNFCFSVLDCDSELIRSNEIQYIGAGIFSKKKSLEFYAFFCFYAPLLPYLEVVAPSHYSKFCKNSFQLT